MPLCGVRGATTSAANEREAVLSATRELLSELVRANPALTPGSALAAFFTTTPDLDAAFPAAAARAMGFDRTALLGATEVGVPGAPERCIRVLFLYETTSDGRPAPATWGSPVYLGGAAALRPDMAGVGSADAAGGAAGIHGAARKDGDRA